MGKPNWLHKLKYNNTPKMYNDKLYHSTLEADYAKLLDTLLKGKELKSVEAQPRFYLKVNDKTICTIVPDFLVVTKNGQKEIREIKGIETPEWRIKWKLMQALYPEFKYYVIKKGDF